MPAPDFGMGPWEMDLSSFLQVAILSLDPT